MVALSSSGTDRVVISVLEALGSSLDIRVALGRAYPLLLRLIPADYAALGLISKHNGAENQEWILAQMPASFFAAYPAMAPYDFVRDSVGKRPNVVLRDHEMLSRTELEANVMYRRAREVGAPIEQVMSVMLHIDERSFSGLSICRERRRAFSDAEAASLRAVMPSIANTVRNCQNFGGSLEWRAALEKLLDDERASVVLVAPPATEVARSDGAARLVEKWFAPHERRPRGLPTPLSVFVRKAFCHSPAHGTSSPQERTSWMRSTPDATLTVSFMTLAHGATEASAMLVLRESANRPARSAWRLKLTARERSVSEAVIRGWDNCTIASELGCSVATIKKHLQNVFDKLGVDSRTALIARALQCQADES